MKNVLVQERRKKQRVALDIQIDVCLLPGDDVVKELSVLPCRARDISGGGVSFYGEMLYPKHSLLRLCIPLPPQRAVLNVMGKVSWSRRNGNAENYATGVQFLNIYEGDFAILDRYVQEILAG